MTLVATLRSLRHGPLRGLGPLWVALGRLYQGGLGLLPRAGGTEQHIGAYGPFQMDARFAFSDFANWGGRHNNGFQACIEACRGKSCVFDVGAHIGLVTLPLSQVMAEDGRVYAFEPADANRHCLEEHLQLNRIENVEIVNALVGDEARDGVRFFQQSQPTGMNSVAAPILDESYRESRRRQVTLDDFCRDRGLAPEVIKIDVEGGEIGVLEGARETLGRCRPLVFLSVHPKHLAALGQSCEQLARLIDALDYDCRDMAGRGVTAFRLEEYLLEPRG